MYALERGSKMQDYSNEKQENVENIDTTDYTEIRRKPSNSFKNLFDVIEALIYAIVAVLVIFTFFARLTIVQGPSMESTLKDGEYLVVGNLFFTYTPDNGDIVVIHGDFQNYHQKKQEGVVHQVGYNYSDPIVKRVIATEGQKVKINYLTHEVFVDDVLLNEDYAQYIGFPTEMSLGEYKYDENGEIIKDAQGNPVYFPFYNDGIFETTVPKGHIFVMGDNRFHSADSRLSDIGFIPEEFIVGKAIFRFAPFTVF